MRRNNFRVFLECVSNENDDFMPDNGEVCTHLIDYIVSDVIVTSIHQ